MKKRKEMSENEELKKIISTFEKLHEISIGELAEAKAQIKGYEAMLNLSTIERKQSYETLDAFRSVQEVSRQELIHSDKLMQNILKIDRQLVASSNLKPLMTTVLLTAIKTLQAEFGIIYMEKENEIGPAYFENITEEGIRNKEYIQALVQESMVDHKRSLILGYNTILGNEGKKVTYLSSHLKQDDKIVGVIYLEKSTEDGFFHESDLNTLEIFCLQIAISLQLAKTNAEVISMLKELNDKNKSLQTMQDSILKLSQTKDVFLSNLSHELQTPLTVIYGFSELLQNKKLNEIDKIHSYAKTIYEEAGKLTELFNDILLITDLDVQKVLKKETFDLMPVIDQCLKKLKLSITEKNLEIIQDITGAVYANKILFIKLLFNLIKNSIFYNKQNGKVEISVRIYQDLSGSILKIKIKDTGIGIAKEFQEKVFEKFFRVDSSLLYEVAGVGLGLFIARRIVDLHGGTIDLESELGSGTTIKINLPIDGSKT